MAANYWSSTQRQFWTFSKQEIAEMRENLDKSEGSLSQQYPLPENRLLNIYFHQQLVKLGKRLIVRQQVLATAQVYLKRYFLKVPVRRTNPYIIIATAFYLACKMEECPQHIRLVMVEARNTWPEMPNAEAPRLGECEFGLISELNSQLIVHHPYRTLQDLGPKFSLSQDETSLSSSIINDHYLTDLPLLYPPHVVAITAIFLSLVLRPNQVSLQSHSSHPAGLSTSVSAAAVAGALQNLGAANRGAGAVSQGHVKEPQAKVARLVQWLAESEVDVAAMVDCIQEIVSLYEKWDQYQDKVCKEQIGRYVKARELDK